MTAERGAQSQHSRTLATWFLWTSVTGTLLLAVASVVLWRLPRWAPAWAARYSPSLDYALWAVRQDHTNEAYDILVGRAWEWEGGIAAFLRHRWQSGEVGRHHPLERSLLREMCQAEEVTEGAKQRLSSARVDQVMQRFRERSRDDLLAACLVQLERREVEFREDAAYNLAYLHDPRAVPALIQRLDDIQVEVGEKAARALGAIGDLSAIPALIRHALRYPQRDPKPYLNAVAWIKDPVAEEHLIAMLAVPSDWARERVMLRLMVHRTSASLSAVVRLIVDESKGTATRARNLLKATLTREEVALLGEYLLQDDAALQAGAVVALQDARERFGIPQAVLP